MDPFTITIALIVVGAIFLAIEAFSPGGFMVIPGTVLIILGILGLVYPEYLLSWWSPAIAVAVAVPITLVTMKFYQRLAVPEPPATKVAETLIGKHGTVTVATEPGNLKGKVVIGSETWSATSDEPIEAGASVEIMFSEGVHVHVRRCGEE